MGVVELAGGVGLLGDSVVERDAGEHKKSMNSFGELKN